MSTTSGLRSRTNSWLGTASITPSSTGTFRTSALSGIRRIRDGDHRFRRDFEAPYVRVPGNSDEVVAASRDFITHLHRDANLQDRIGTERCRGDLRAGPDS